LEAKIMKKTIRTIFRLTVLLLLLVGWGLAASALHVVWSGHKLVIIPKDHVGIHDTYANTSAWTPGDVAAHPALSQRLLATGNQDALAGAFKADSPDDLTSQIKDAIAKGPASSTQPAGTIAEKVQDRVQQAVHHVQASVGH